jgi:hypothetical protein
MEKPSEFTNDPRGYAKRWTAEFSAARKFLRVFQEDGDKIVDRFLDQNKSDLSGFDSSLRLNLFFSNIVTLKSMLFGKLPTVDVSRTFNDADDDEARVASLMLTRILNQDIQEEGEDYASVMRQALEDRLLPGSGNMRLRFQAETQMQITPAITDPTTGMELAPAVEQEIVTDVWTESVYTHWKDILYSPARTYGELRWKAFRAFMDRDALVKRFGEEKGKLVPLKSKGPLDENKSSEAGNTPWMQAEVWEIWDKINKQVCYFVEGMDETLECGAPPLELDGFWPDPPPMMANTTTSKFIARADFMLAKSLYDEIDNLQTRITILTDACKLVGVYDKGSEGVQRILNEGVESQLIPIDSWAAFAEKGGMKGAIDWLPIEQVVIVIEKLQQVQGIKIQQLYEVTGLADILRGAAQAGASATQDRLKAQFASIRVQALQDEFARFASDAQKIKVNIISKHYPPEQIMLQSNIKYAADGSNQQLIDGAIKLIKDGNLSKWRILVKPETLAMADYAQLKLDRTDFIMSISQFMQSAAPLTEQAPQATPLLLQLLKWGLAGFKGAQEVEGIIDQAVEAMKQNPPGDKPDPAVQKAQAEMQAKMQEAQMKAQQSQQEHQMEMQRMMLEMKQDREKHALEMQALLAKLQGTIVGEAMRARTAAAGDNK